MTIGNAVPGGSLLRPIFEKAIVPKIASAMKTIAVITGRLMEKRVSHTSIEPLARHDATSFTRGAGPLFQRNRRLAHRYLRGVPAKRHSPPRPPVQPSTPLALRRSKRNQKEPRATTLMRKTGLEPARDCIPQPPAAPGDPQPSEDRSALRAALREQSRAEALMRKTGLEPARDCSR